MASPARAPRADNRLPLILDEAARLFGERGFHGTTIRDVVRGIDMLPGSLYYHFAAKEDLLAAVYGEGVARITERVRAAIAKRVDPWQRLTAACVAHLEALLAEGDYAQVVIRVRPADVPAIAARLTALRDRYERMFVELIDALPVRSNVDRRTLRLMLLGALNWSQTWYRPGHDDPRAIARNFVALLRRPTEPATA
ncbi:MAG TPA: TetR/AcrR family transcriptional regulator [Casimicrobiaceae bacterium]|nr:TetR/AcrR family transcriptional regulator [Casimicrobiaceae bacterium]